MTEPQRCIGIDVAKAWLDVAERPSGRSWRVANDEAGWRELVDAVGAGGAALVVLEASGGDEVGVVTALDLAGAPPGGGQPRGDAALRPEPGAPRQDRPDRRGDAGPVRGADAAHATAASGSHC